MGTQLNGEQLRDMLIRMDMLIRFALLEREEDRQLMYWVVQAFAEVGGLEPVPLEQVRRVKEAATEVKKRRLGWPTGVMPVGI